MKVSDDLDRRFRERAFSEGSLDVAYDLVDSPIGALLVAVTERGLCRIEFDPEPERDRLGIGLDCRRQPGAGRDGRPVPR